MRNLRAACGTTIDSVLACIFLLILLVLTPNEAHALQQSNAQCGYGTNSLDVDSGNVRIVPTFHSFSVYWSPSNGSANVPAHVLFREAGSSEAERRSLDLPYAPADGEYRGSVVHLKSGTQYELTLMRDGIEQETVVAETWCEQFPIVETRYINGPTTISGVNGTPDGYILYTADPNGSNVIEGGTNSLVIDDSSYVIVRGLELRNAARDAVMLKGTTNNIVFEENVIEGWGGVSSTGFGEKDHAIGNSTSGQGNNFGRLIIQRNIIRNPRADTNSWAEFNADGWRCDVTWPKRCHPYGPGPIWLEQTAGNHVIRYNEIYSTNGNYFNDIIGGGQNFSSIGNVHRDTDIYGNILSHAWDDAIEAEGGNSNIRIWGNLIDLTHVAVAISPTIRGPVYVFRNVVNRTQYSPFHGYQSGVFIKAKSDGSAIGIGNYVFHNTIVDGVANGITAFGTSLAYFTSRNNILDARNDLLNSEWTSLNDTNDFDFGLYEGRFNEIDGPPVNQANGIQGLATFDSSQPYAVAQGSSGHDDGEAVSNFSENAVGAPDMGAQERDAAPLEFGVAAYPVNADDNNLVPTGEFAIACSGLECNLEDQSVDPDGEVVKWAWDFGDGNTSTARNPKHKYASKGKYKVTLSVTDDKGAKSDPPASKSVSVDPDNIAPVADDDSYTTDEDVVLDVAAPGVLAGDSDGDGDPLSAVLETTTSNGSLKLNDDGSFSYTPKAGFAGQDSFTYHASDGTDASNIATVTITVNADETPKGIEATFVSIAGEDGWVLESSEYSDAGGKLNYRGAWWKALRAGDDDKDRQYKFILSFDTSSLPNNANITSVALELTRGRNSGTDPLTTHGALRVDIKKGTFGKARLERGDYQAKASAEGVATVNGAGLDFSATLNDAGIASVNKSGRTQLRAYFQVPDNDDLDADIVGFHSGDDKQPSRRPKLIVTYTLPSNSS